MLHSTGGPTAQTLIVWIEPYSSLVGLHLFVLNGSANSTYLSLAAYVKVVPSSLVDTSPGRWNVTCSGGRNMSEITECIEGLNNFID